MDSLLLTELKTPELIYDTYKEWLSELDFIFDEESIIEELINSHFIELCNFELYNQSKEVVEQLKLNKHKLNHLKTDIYIQQKYLSTLIESNNVIGEKEFYVKHKVISQKKIAYYQSVKDLKSNAYDLIKEILRKNKQKKIT
ncbi:MAG: hypothetical protein Q7U08_07710 [Flavobacteriaceae bacterium]|nr:hypothetical protein [Flavobacteriaceae bacterium]